jgi:pimeloyl-ACP methyl ester carboxylesterase
MAIDIHEKVAEIEGIPVSYRDAGKGETIVFLHGAGGAPPRGAAFHRMLAEKHRVLIPSRPGYDGTPPGSHTGNREAAELIAAFIRKVAGGPVHVVAQSAGGAVGCWLSILHPDLVTSLTLSAPAAFAGPHRAHGGPPPSPQEIERRLYGDKPTWDTPPTEEEGARIRKNAQGYMQRGLAGAANEDLKERLGEIKAPTLLLVATRDEVVPAEAMAPYQRAIHTCYRMFIYGAAHEMPISACAKWVNLVADYIDRGESFVVNIGARSP